MTADLRAWPLRIWVGGQEWSPWATLREIGWSSYDGGIITKSATLAIARSPNNPESIDPRTNRSRWRPGQIVTGQLQRPDGVWVAHPLLPLIISSEPKPPGRTRSAIELQLVCRLAYLQNIPAPDEDKSEVAVDQPIDYSEVARRYLLAGQAQTNQIGLTSWGYALNYPHQKSGGGSWIQEAAGLAEICGRYLYCDSAGIIRSRPLSLTATPALTLTIGQEESLWDDSQEEAAPPQLVRVTANGKKPAEAPPGSGASNLPERICTYGNLDGLAPNLTGYGEVVCQRIYPQIRSNLSGGGFKISARTEQLARGYTISPKMPPPLGIMRTAKDSEIESFYNAKGQLYKTIETVKQPAISIKPEETQNKTLMVTVSLKTTTYGFGTGNEVLSIDIEDKAARRAVWDGAAAINEWNLVPRYREGWDYFKRADGQWWSRHSLMKSLADINNSAVTGEDDAYQLVGDPRASVMERSDPPAIQTYGDSAAGGGLEDVEYFAEERFEHPGGAVDREFKRNFALSAPAISNDQLKPIAKIFGALLWGRNQGFEVGAAIDKFVSIDYPLPCVEVVEPPPPDWLAVNPPNKIHRLLADTLTFTHATDRAEVQAYGIWLGTGSAGGQPVLPPYINPISVLLPVKAPDLKVVVEEDDVLTVYGSIALTTSSCAAADISGTPRQTKWFRPDAPGIYNLSIAIPYGVSMLWACHRTTQAGTGYSANQRLHFRRNANGSDEWFNAQTSLVLAEPPNPDHLSTAAADRQIMHLVRFNAEPTTSNFNSSAVCQWHTEVVGGRARITADATWRWFSIRTPNPANMNFDASPAKPFFDTPWFTIDSPVGSSVGNGQQWILRRF